MHILRKIGDGIISIFLTSVAIWGANLVLPGVTIDSIQDMLLISLTFSILTYLLSYLSSSSLSLALLVFLIQTLAISVMAYRYPGFTLHDTLSAFMFSAMVVLLQIFIGVKRG